MSGRAILGVAVAKLSDKGGDLVGALTVADEDEVLVVFEKGNIVRSRVDEVRLTGRNTMGVQFAKPGRGDAIVAVARNVERESDESEESQESQEAAGGAESGETADAAAAADGVPFAEKPDDESTGGQE